MDGPELDIEVASSSDLEWEELASDMLGPEDFVNQSTSDGTTYGPTYDITFYESDGPDN